MTDENKVLEHTEGSTEEVAKFAESYATFTRIVNSLQRKYIELQEEFSAQNSELAEANRKLLELGKRNSTATEFLNGILASMNAGVIAVDQDGIITHFNPAASVILGIPRQFPVGKAYRDLIPPGDAVDATALRTAETGREVESVEKRIDLADGTRLHVSVSTSMLTDNEGRNVGAVEVMHDLTKIKKMEREIARLNTLAALGEMAATIAHEVRNPLSGIGGFAALLDRELEDGDSKKELVKRIIRGVNSLNETVETLLNYTRFEEMNRTDVGYGDFLRQTIEQFKLNNQARLAGCRIVLHAPESRSGEAVVLKIDKMLFRQILFNILTNGIDAIGSEGTLTVVARKLSRQTALELYGEKVVLGVNETVVETTVRDTGPGIGVENLDKIFSPFFTTKREGNGLGLAVAWKIAKAHGGDIMVANASEGPGAVFTLLMPSHVGNIHVE